MVIALALRYPVGHGPQNQTLDRSGYFWEQAKHVPPLNPLRRLTRPLHNRRLALPELLVLMYSM